MLRTAHGLDLGVPSGRTANHGIPSGPMRNGPMDPKSRLDLLAVAILGIENMGEM